MKKIILIITVMLSFTVTAQIESDKVLHMVGSGGIGIATHTLFRGHFEMNRVESYTLSFVVGNAIGFAKEAGDSVFDWEDIKYNNIGLLVGNMVSDIIMTYLNSSTNAYKVRLEKKRKRQTDRLDSIYNTN